MNMTACYVFGVFFFFFSSRRRHTRFDCDWSSDVCSSDLDGSPSAALRLIYWRLLALAEGAGHGWRVTAETPAEYQRRLAATDSRWDARSEERRVGEEGRSRWAPYHLKKKKKRDDDERQRK